MECPRRPLPTLVAFVAAVSLSTAPSAASAQTIVGRVVDSLTSQPIEDVLVLLLRDDRELLAHVRTTQTGEFALPMPGPGAYAITTRYLGYEPETIALPPLDLGHHRIPDEALRLTPVPTMLDPVTVEAERTVVHLERVGFAKRRDDGVGNYATLSEFENRQPARLTDILRRLPRLRVGLNPNYGRDGDMRRMLVMSRRARCPPNVFLDGLWMGSTRDIDVDNLTTVAQIAAIEAYAGMSDTPPVFRRRGQACGAVVLWTRRG